MDNNDHNFFDSSDKQMRILILCDLFPPDVVGGYELRCEEACWWLHQNGYQVEVLTTKSGDGDREYPFPVHRLLTKYELGKTPPAWSFSKRVFLAIKDNLIFKKLLKNSKPDMIYIWNLTGISRTLVPYIFFSKTKKLVDVSSSWLLKVYTQYGPVYRVLESKTQKKFYTILISCLHKLIPVISFHTIKEEFAIDFSNVSGYFTSKWNKRAHTDKIKQCETFLVIHTGIDLNEFPYKEKGFDSSKIRLLFVGRIQEEKGFILLLDQLKYFKQTYNNPVELRVIGRFDNPEKEYEIKTIIERLGLKGNIIFLGQKGRRELSDHYNKSDFTVFPSIIMEAFSRIPLESMACGTPCLSTDNPGSKELFDLNAPLIYLDRTPDGLLKGLQPFLSDQALYINTSLAGRRFVEDSFTFDHFMCKVEDRFLKENLLSIN